jgi:hypothetical protein
MFSISATTSEATYAETGPGHKVAGSSPAGCRSSARANIKAIQGIRKMNLKNAVI